MNRPCASVLHPCLAAAALAFALSLSSAAQTPNTAKQSAAKLNNVGVAYMNQQLPEKALQKFEEAYKADSSSAVPIVNEGIAYLYLRKLPEAETTLKKATSLDAKSVRGWYSLGLTHFTGGNSDAALSEFQHALALDTQDANTHYFIGTIYFNQKKYPEAAAELEKALQLSPLHASAQFGLARVLQREGKADEAREHLKRFQEITQSKIGTVMSTTYGEQGSYAIAEDILSAGLQPGPMIPVKFELAKQSTTSAAQAASSPLVGIGACIADLEGNGSKDLVSMTSAQGLHVYRIGRDGSLALVQAEQLGLAAKGDGTACAVGDYDNDGLPDLALALTDRVLLFHNLGHGKFSDITATVGIKPLNHPAGLTFVDFDHDGDLDLLVTGEAQTTGASPNVLWRNNGNSTFTEWSKQTGLAGSASTHGAALSDINNDRAIDLLVSGSKGGPQLYENQREGAFKQVALYSEALSAPRGLTVSDFNKDGRMDVAVTHEGSPALSIWQNQQGQGFKRVPLNISGATSAWGLTPIDIDNDGWIDLAVIVETASGTEVRVLRNIGSKGFEDVSASLTLNKLTIKDARSIIAADVDGDGAADLIVTRSNAGPVVLRNVGGNRNHSLRLQLTGLADNKSAIGTKVEVFADGNWQKFEVSGASGYLSQGSSEIIAGLGASEHADIVSLLWPTGVPQDELDIAANTKSLTELDRRGSSCPVLFTWDGSKYKFVTDVIGAAVVGHWISPTAYNKADTDEWVKIDGQNLRARNGKLSVRFGEPMEEVNYIDQLRMVAIDHPEGTDVYPDERFLDDPPFASGKTILASTQTHALAGAWDDHGRDVLPLLAAQDHNYVRDFTILSYAGFTNTHALTLDIGPWSPKNPLRLFAHGYIEYFSASSMYAAWQAGISPTSPSIEAQLPDGTWKTVIADAGFPAGLPRTVVFDLTGKLPEGARRIRLKTNLQIYWDQITVDNAPENPRSFRQTELPLSSAHLAFRGYPKQIEGSTPGDLTYDYQSISMTGPFQWAGGGYTRYGDVTPLLTGRDDHYVIFGSGEDVDAEFSDTYLPALPPNWKRDYFFYADGFVKDMDFYEAMPFTVAEMPFHRMSGYPYTSSEHFPTDATTLKYQLDWNDRTESGNRSQRFQFNYKPTLSEPIQPSTKAQDIGGTR